MRRLEFAVGPNDDGRRLDRFLSAALPGVSSAALQKALRLKDVKLDGVRAPGDARVAAGQRVELYLPDAAQAPVSADDAWSKVENPALTVVYEDEHLLALHKPPGMSCQPDEHGAVHTLETQLRAYLYRQGEWDPLRENGFSPSLCHRLDRNTEGLVLAAKTAPALRILCEKIAAREISKEYLCLVHGTVTPKTGELTDFLLKNEQTRQVSVYSSPRPGARTAVLRYEVLQTGKGLSLLRCRLITGRTHQIRAQWASRGHPLLGDGKYGRRERALSLPGQALCADRITFSFTTPAGALSYLAGKTLTLARVAFAEAYQNGEIGVD